MFKSMTDEHKKELIKLIILGFLTLVLSLYYHKYVTNFGIIVVFGILYIILGFDVIKKSIQMIKRGQALDENFLMSIATLTAFVIGQYPEAISVMLFYNFGNLFENIATHKSRENIKELLNLVPEVANRVNPDGSISEIDLDEIEVGDIILVRDGEKIGVDGVVVKGHGIIDTSSITGESMPVEVDVGSRIISSSIMTEGIIQIEAQKEFEDSIAAKIMELIEESAASKSQSEKTVTRFARVYTPIVVGLAITIGIIPPLFFGGAWSDYLLRAATFLVLSCPCALVLSVPLTFISGLGLSSANGILIKGSQYFESLNQAEILLTDKTGTLTTGKFKIQDIKYFGNVDKNEILDYIYNIELLSTHPIARGIVSSLNRKEKPELFKSVVNEKGFGIKALIQNNKEIKIGSKRYVGYSGEENLRTIYLYIDENLVAKIIIEDDIKINSKETIQNLKKHFKEILLVSGDSESVVKETARKLELTHYFAEVLPNQKLEVLNNYKNKGKKIVFVGDGINDAPVLANADVGISMGESASDLAIESSDILIVNGEFSKLNDLMKISDLTNKTVKENITFILLVKIAIIILGFFGKSNMWMAIFGDVGVSIIAILWAMRILKKKI